MNIEQLGQIFTPSNIVQQMINLIQNKGNILEPSCGNGAFLNILPSTTIGIEVDPKVCLPNCLNVDFFDYPTSNKFNTIIGNPPYVAYKNILPSTKSKLPKSGNLYIHFINKCLDHLEDNGELIFITPRDFIKSTSAIELNSRLWNEGTFTHFYDLGDEIVFPNASPNASIWRWERHNFNRHTKTNQNTKNFCFNKGQIYFSNNNYKIPFTDLFSVKVGGVSGLDKYFEHPDGEDFVCSYTAKTGKTKKLLNLYHPDLEQYKSQLIQRKIKKFNESNWYTWGRNCFKSDKDRIYVNCKTRNANPFFTHSCKNYDGAVLAIFTNYDVEAMKDKLNQVDWNELGFKVGGRYIFGQKSLENCLLPEDFLIIL